MTNFAVLHITKYKELSGIGAHIDRKHTPENADRVKSGFNEEVVEGSDMKLSDVLGSSVDKSKSKLNEHVRGKTYKKLSACVEERIAEGHTVIDKRTGQVATIRKDAVKALGIILTGSHERMVQIQGNELLFDQWKRDNYDFACRMWGEKNIVRFTLHMDEKTPHFHCVVVPINSEGRLSARSFINGTDQLRNIQDQYGEAMKKYGLDRGVPTALSHRMHIKTSEYYQSAQTLIEQTKELTESIKKSNFLKLDKIREEMNVNVSKLKISLMEQEYKLKYTAITNNSHMQSIKRAGMERGFQQDTVKACEYIKKEIPLIPFACQELGWSIVKEKSTKKDVVLTHKEHGKIIVPTQPKEHTGHWVYSHTNGGGGTLVDLLRAEMWDWERIRELAKDKTMGMGYQQVYEKTHKKETNNELAEDDKRIIQKQRLEPEKQRQEVEKYLGGIVPAKNEGFVKNREIDKDTYRDMAGLTVSKQSAVFHLYNDLDKEGDKQLCSSITYYHDRMGDSKKFFQKDLPRGLSVLIEDGRELKYVSGIFITESPVDALSYKQLYPDETKDMAFVSTCGSLSMGIKRDLEQVCQMAKERDQSVMLGFDNDIAGRKMSEIVAASLREEGIKYEVMVPKHGKDWNEELKWVNNPSLQRYEEMDKRMEQKRGELFKECAYDQSLLPKLGIEQSTYMAFKENMGLKCNEQALSVDLKVGRAERNVDGEGRSVTESKQQKTVVNDGMDSKKLEIDDINRVKSKKIRANDEMNVSRNWTLAMKGSKLSEYLSKSITGDNKEHMFVLNGDVEKAQKVILVASPIEAMVHCQQKVGQANDSETRNAVLANHLKENCYIYCPVEDKGKAKEVIIDLMEQVHERKQKVAWIADSEHDLLTRLMGDIGREVDQKADQKIEMEAVKQYGKGMERIMGGFLDLISSLSDQDENSGMDGVDDDDDEDDKKKRGKGRRLTISM